MTLDYAICIDKVSKRYHLRNPIQDSTGKRSKEFWALKNVSLNVRKGESVGIVGPNGSGKSTLLKIIAGVIKPTSGTVKVYGHLASILDLGAGFHPELSGLDNILINGQLLGFSRSEIKEKKNQIIEFSGLGKFINEPVKNYSSGMYLRLAFSILIHLEADIYIFDEVMAVGDQEFRDKCFAKLRERILDGRTNLIVSHEKSLLSLMTTRIIEFPEIKEKTVASNFSFARNNLSSFSNNITLESFEHIQTLDDQQFDIILSGIPANEVIDIAITFRSLDRPSDYISICSLHPLGLNHTKNQNTELHYRAKLPAYSIIHGKYEASLRIIYNKTHIIKNFENSLVFTVEMMSEVKDLFYNKYPGSIRLKANWDIKT